MAVRGVTTGISAADRAHTIRAVLDPLTMPADIAWPHFSTPPHRWRCAAMRRKTDASVNLARLAGVYPAGVICEIMNDDGTMARMPQLEVIAARHGIRMISVTQLIAYRRGQETLVRAVGRAMLPTA